MIGTALAGLILGLGSVTIGTTLVQASERDGLAGFFEMLFGGPRQPVVAPPRQPARYANLPEPRLHRAQRPDLRTPHPRAEALPPAQRRWTRRLPREDAAVTPAGTPARVGGRTVCVRMCDGYLFPLGDLRSRADVPVHQAACAAACPNAATRVYTLASGETDLERAVGPQGIPYRASALANVYRQRRVQNCSCQAEGAVAHRSIAGDMTLREGDVVATAGSAGVVTRLRSGRVELTDFRQAGLSRGRARQIEARVGTLRRDEEARSFRRLLRAGRADVVRVAGVGDGVRGSARAAREDGSAPVRVVAPSPFR